MTDEYLEKLKKTYLRSSIPDYLKEDGWEDLEKKLDQPVKKTNMPFYYSRYAFITIVLILVGGVISALIFSKPDTPLYPIKQATEHNIQNTNNTPQTHLNTIATPSALPILKLVPTPTPNATPTITPTPSSTPKSVFKSIDHLLQNLIPENQQHHQQKTHGKKIDN